MSNQLVVGSTSAVQTLQSTGTAWPNTWTWPTYPTYYYPVAPPAEEYANEVEVDQHEHDATLRFYRKRGKGLRTLVKEVTVPIGVLEWLQGVQSDQ